MNEEIQTVDTNGPHIISGGTGEISRDEGNILCNVHICIHMHYLISIISICL